MLVTANDVVVVAGPINKGPETASGRKGGRDCGRHFRAFHEVVRRDELPRREDRRDQPATVMARLIVFLTGEDREPR